MTRILVIVAGLLLAALAIWHPAPQPALTEQALTVPVPAIAPVSERQRRVPRPRRVAGPLPIVVYVAGAVRRPGLYRLQPDSRADDAIRLAGGETAGADPIAVNLAAHVADGDEIAVPLIGETAPRRTTHHRVRTPRSRKRIPSAPVDVNASTAAELAAVPGIGPTIADRIVEVRQRDGAYASLDELLDVAGMSPARLDRAQEYLVVR